MSRAGNMQKIKLLKIKATSISSSVSNHLEMKTLSGQTDSGRFSAAWFKINQKHQNNLQGLLQNM